MFLFSEKEFSAIAGEKRGGSQVPRQSCRGAEGGRGFASRSCAVAVWAVLFRFVFCSFLQVFSCRIFLWPFVCNLTSPSFLWADLFGTTEHVEYDASLCIYSAPGVLVRCRQEGEVSSFLFYEEYHSR